MQPWPEHYDASICSPRSKISCLSFHNGSGFRTKVIAIIGRNYDILDALLREGTESVDLMDLLAMGFVPGMVTSYRKSGKHDVFACYDIKYIMTGSRVYSIMKINNLSVNLQVGTELKDR